MSKEDIRYKLVDLRQADVERHLHTIGLQLGQTFEPLSDPHLSYYLTVQNFLGGNKVHVGRIQLSLPYFGWYRVALADLGGVYPCCRISPDSSPSLFGSIDTTVLPPDCAVLVSLSPGGRVGSIIGVMPSVVEDGNQVFSDWVGQGSNASFMEPYHSDYFTKTGDEGGVIDYSNQKPLDSLTTDWGRATSTGLMLHLDPALIYLRVSEVCGVFGFFPSNTLRVAGHELQVDSAMHEVNYQNDEGENQYYLGESAYPWEEMGAFSKDTVIHEETSDEDVHTKRVKGKFEPKEPDQKPFHRYEEHGGYTGQGRIRQMSIPPDQPPELYTYSGTEMPIGVFREFIGLDGTYMLETAKQAVWMKRTMIPHMKRIRPTRDRREDSDSSENDNYRFSGVYGEEGDEHKLADVEKPAQHSSEASVMGCLDTVAFIANWQGVNAFHYHGGDYKLEQESETEFGTDQLQLDFATLAGKCGFDPVNFESYKIDERMTAKFYKLIQMLHFTDDGGVVLLGGYGEQIRMVNGRLFLDAPDGIYVRPGKSFVVLAGDDAIITARNSVDLTASNKDVRIKAEKNFQLLAANSGKGAMLFESGATSRDHEYPATGGESIEGSGIVFKAANSQVVALASNIYFRTGNPDGRIGVGNIVLDAAKGDADLIFIGGTHHRFAKNLYRDAFGYPKVTGVNISSSSGSVCNGTMRLNGSLTIRGSVSALSGFETAQGHYQSPAGGDVGVLRNAGQVLATVNSVRQVIASSVSEATKTYKNDVETEYYNPSKVGAAATEKAISFSFRTESDCNTSSFTMPEAHWQLLARGQGLTSWQEKVVRYQEETEQMPWPGKAKWADEETLVTLPASSLTMYDVTTGRAKDRPTPYEEPKLGTPILKTPNSDYKVINV